MRLSLNSMALLRTELGRSEFSEIPGPASSAKESCDFFVTGLMMLVPASIRALGRELLVLCSQTTEHATNIVHVPTALRLSCYLAAGTLCRRSRAARHTVHVGKRSSAE